MACQCLFYVYIERSDGNDRETQTGLFFSLDDVVCIYLYTASRVTRRVLNASCLQVATSASEMTAVRLYPPLFEEGKSAEFLRTGRTLSVTQSPRDNSVAVYATNTAVG